MPFCERGPVSLHYEEAGSGFPLLVLPGGGLNAAISSLTGSRPGSPKSPFNPLEEFADAYRCIALDLRNANHGQSFGPLEIDRPWDAFTDDQLGLMDHLGIDRFMVLGFCISGPLIWNLLKRAPDRVVAAVLAQPSGFNPEAPTIYYDNNMKNWAPELCARRPDRDFVRNCQTPVLIRPDDMPAHPYATAMESAELAPNAQVSLYPWKRPESRIPIAVRHVRTFLKAHAPAA